MKRKIDYLFQRPGSRNWWLRLQGPDKRTEKSLKTPDRVQAEILALPEIAKHKASLLALRPHLETSWRRTYEPGLHDGPDAPDGEADLATQVRSDDRLVPVLLPLGQGLLAALKRGD